jgi:hypothetical protein
MVKWTGWFVDAGRKPIYDVYYFLLLPFRSGFSSGNKALIIGIMKKGLVLSIVLLMAIGLEILHVYFIMPFPGSQRSNTIGMAYFIDNNIGWMRILFILIMISLIYSIIGRRIVWQSIVLLLGLAVYGVVIYFFNFRFLADKMFLQPTIKSFATAMADTASNNKLIIGVSINGVARAYPIEIIGYHHQVTDTVGMQPILVTYCTVCRTGRVYSPEVNGKMEHFRLVGMDHFNAMFEDATTKSWWQQATGTAIAGKLKGAQLKEIPSAQMRLADWLFLHPASTTLLPDSNFKIKYDSLKGYDEGIISSRLEKRDTASWKFKSWVIGVNLNGRAKAYDWNHLLYQNIIQDTFAGMPLLLIADKQGKSFFVLNRNISGTTLDFIYDASKALLRDTQSQSYWQINGNCVDGLYKGRTLSSVQAYQEFWHSWKNFHPQTIEYPKTR